MTGKQRFALKGLGVHLGGWLLLIVSGGEPGVLFFLGIICLGVSAFMLNLARSGSGDDTSDERETESQDEDE